MTKRLWLSQVQTDENRSRSVTPASRSDPVLMLAGLGVGKECEGIKMFDSPFMDLKQAAVYLCLARSTVSGMVQNKVIPHRKHGGKLVFHKGELDAWSEARARRPETPSISRFQSVRERLRSLTIQDTAILSIPQKGVG